MSIHHYQIESSLEEWDCLSRGRPGPSQWPSLRLGPWGLFPPAAAYVCSRRSYPSRLPTLPGFG